MIEFVRDTHPNNIPAKIQNDFKDISRVIARPSLVSRSDRPTDGETDRHTHKTDGRTVTQTDTGNDNNPGLVPGGNKNSNRYRTTVNPTGSTAKCVAIAMNPIALSSVTISEYNARILYHGFCISGTWNIHQQCTLFNKEYQRISHTNPKRYVLTDIWGGWHRLNRKAYDLAVPARYDVTNHHQVNCFFNRMLYYQHRNAELRMTGSLWVHQWIPLTNVQSWGKIFYDMTSSWYLGPVSI